MEAIRTQHIRVQRKRRLILADINLTFSPQTVHFLIGRNGSGKTTLLRCLNQSTSYQGEVWLGDEALHRMSPTALAKRMAWVPQDIPVYPHLSTYDYVLMGRFPHLNWLGTYQNQDHVQTRAAMQQMGITEMAKQPIAQLSGGERQKAAIARALAQETDMLLLDEPSHALDPLARRQLNDMLFSLAHEQGKTIICSTHDLEGLTRSKARVIGLQNGKVVWEEAGGQPEALLLAKVYAPQGPV